MSHDPLAPIWARLDSLQPVFFHYDLGRALGAERDRLVGLDVLKETICGPSAIGPDDLRRWVVDVPELLARVCVAAGIRAARAELVEGHLWFVGTAQWGGRSHQVYFARATHARTRESVVAALAPRPRAVLLHPTEHAAWRWGAATPNPSVALESVVGLGPDGLTFDSGAVEDRLTDARAGETGAEPVPKRAIRALNIARLTEEVVAHLRRARDHAFATRDLSKAKVPKLLRRPTLKKLGELVGLEPYDVTRCFDDETARELNLYWEMALDLDAVMRFQGPIATGRDE